MCFLLRALLVDLRGATGITPEEGRWTGIQGVSESMTSDAIVGIPSMYTESRDTVDWGETAPRQRGEVIFK